MKTEEQRIAIAEACGWTKVQWYEDNAGPPILHGFPPYTVTASASGEWEATRPGDSKTVPAYPSDLNACAQFEEWLMEGNHRNGHYYRYRDHLEATLQGFVRLPISATAAQRCEAFLRTLNLWKD